MSPFEALAVSLGPTLTGVAALVMAVRTGRKVDGVKKEVTPNNDLTNGETADAILTKIIQMLPKSEMSVKDTRHMDDMVEIDPALAKMEDERK